MTFLLAELEGTATRGASSEVLQMVLPVYRSHLDWEARRCGASDLREAENLTILLFHSAGDALRCALGVANELASHHWSDQTGAPKVRMVLHTEDVPDAPHGDAGAAEGAGEEDTPDGSLGAAREILAAARGGEIFCSEAASVLLRRSLPEGVHLVDLGPYRLKSAPAPERLYQVSWPEAGLRDSGPDLERPASLPLQFSRFFGREPEIAHLAETLLSEDERLVTLTGTAGAGKTRLAVEVAGRLVGAFRGAVWFVSVTDLSDPAQIEEALLVLDNFEHLAPDGGPLVHLLLQRVAALKCLVTSRRLLRVEGERECVVLPLRTPAAMGASTAAELSRCESVQLFVNRTQAVRADFQITERNAAEMAGLCNQLEGIPLALELAASRAQVLSPGQMIEQLRERFDFLVSRRRDVGERYRTLRATLDWSYELLSLPLRGFFAQLSAFRGGGHVEAAEVVCEQPLALDYLAQLRENSLILIEEGADELRFRMLETVREFSISGTVTGGTAGLGGAAVQAGQPANHTQSSTGAVAIPDNNTTGAESSIAVSAVGILTSVQVAVNITHPWRGDLEVTLVHPGGATVKLYDGPRDDSALNLVTSYPNQSQPVQSLAALNGKAANGTWKLRVRDLQAPDGGTLNGWSLTLGFLRTTGSATTAADGTYTISGLAAGTYTVTPAKTGYGFTPANRSVTVGPNATGVNFTGAAAGSPAGRVARTGTPRPRAGRR
jgi:predicted ATPase/subtilisin-like proprotein convertase family protein